MVLLVTQATKDGVVLVAREVTAVQLVTLAIQVIQDKLVAQVAAVAEVAPNSDTISRMVFTTATLDHLAVVASGQPLHPEAMEELAAHLMAHLVILGRLV